MSVLHSVCVRVCMYWGMGRVKRINKTTVSVFVFLPLFLTGTGFRTKNKQKRKKDNLSLIKKKKKRKKRILTHAVNETLGVS